LETNAGKTVNDPVLVDSDELSRTAGLLIQSLKDEENPKFQNSAFMGFMRQIRDKEMVVDGDKIVASSEATVTASAAAPATRTASSILGVGSNAIPVPRERSMTMDGWPMKSVHFDPVTTMDEPMVEASQRENEEDAYWKAENRDYREYWEKAASLSSTPDLPSRLTATLQQREWGALQESWDAWEATETGVKRVAAANYPFQTNNPYVFDSRSGTRGTQSSNEFEQVSARQSPGLELILATLFL
jgi:peroxin-5